MVNFKRMVKANYAQVSFVFLAFALMVIIGCVSVGKMMQKGISTTVTVALNESEKTIRAYLREPVIAYDNIYMAVGSMLDRGESQEAVGSYLTQTTDSLQRQTDEVLGFRGVYGVINGEFIDTLGLNTGDDFIPQQMPWYQLAVRNSVARYTAPYTDPQTGHVIMTLSKELYGAEGDFYGVLALDIDITWMMEYVKSLEFVEGGYGIIVNQYIYTVAHPHAEYRNVHLEELGGDYREISELLRKNYDISAKEIKDTDGSRVIVYFRQLYNNWYMGVVVPVENYYKDLHSTAIALIVPGVVLMLILNYLLLHLSAAKMRSEAENWAKSSFLARMSHEIRTPMNAILGMIELILRHDLPQEVIEDAVAMKQAGVNLLSIINDILDFSKIESGRMEIIEADYYLASLLNDTINIINVRIGETPLKFVINIDNNLPSKLLGDEIRLRQVLLNLLSNAVKYTREGSVTFTISGEPINEYEIKLIFTISDTGIGIKEEDLNKLFHDFTQFDTHKNKGIEGTGLGLTISKNLCTIMGGDISVASRYGEGSVFTVILPQKISDPAPIRVKGPSAAIQKESEPVSFTAPTARILVVDDAEVNLKVARGLLKPYKVEIHSCTNGYKATELIRENLYDIVFMDHMMPEMDGIETVKKIRALANPRYAKLIIVALTANAITGMKEKFLQNGFNDYLAKPIDVVKLNEIMYKWIPQRKQLKTSAIQKEDSGLIPWLSVNGLDPTLGLSLMGGSETIYHEVLSLYCRDSAERLSFLESEPDTDQLKTIAIHIHSIKSASASIGAMELSQHAAILENACKNGDMKIIEDRLEDFKEELTAMIFAIRETLLRFRPEGTMSLDNEILLKLKDGLENRDLEGVHHIIGELMAVEHEGVNRDAACALSDRIILMEFDSALELVRDFIRRD